MCILLLIKLTYLRHTPELELSGLAEMTFDPVLKHHRSAVSHLTFERVDLQWLHLENVIWNMSEKWLYFVLKNEMIRVPRIFFYKNQFSTSQFLLLRFNKPAGGERVCLTYINYIDSLTHQVCGSRGVNVPPQQAASFHSQILSHSRCQRSEGDVGVGRRLFWWGLSFLSGSWRDCRECVVSIIPPVSQLKPLHLMCFLAK